MAFNDAPAASGATQRQAIVSGRHPKLLFLQTTEFPTPGSYVFLSLDRAMAEAGIQPFFNRQSNAQVFIAKAASRLRFVRNIRGSSSGTVFVGLMGLGEYRTLPFSYWTEIIPYCFDCWPNLYERWLSFFKRHRVRVAFFTARKSADYFSSALPEMKSVWLPEATDPSQYSPSKPWSERDIDVLELGRKSDYFHERIVGPLAQANKVHLYERVKGEIIFTGREEFLEGMARSRISVCFPSSVTHPERSGSVETVTQRYFESMASKCLIVGHAPQELIDLFGYNPVVEVQKDSEAEQIQAVLSNPDLYQDMIERNYQRFLEVGTWTSRVATALDILDRSAS